MAFWSAIPVLGSVLDGVIGLIDQAVEDEDEKNRLKAGLEQALMQADLSKFSEQIKAQASIVLGEVKGESWLQRNWRPLLMLIVVAICANNYIVNPYLGAIWPETFRSLELPDRLWDLMTLGVGGYVAGRSGEKIVKSLRGGGS